ncbi:hypothetical protein VTK56DRAFT_1553 [Thermocarpiscus australiensis]
MCGRSGMKDGTRMDRLHAEGVRGGPFPGLAGRSACSCRSVFTSTDKQTEHTHAVLSLGACCKRERRLVFGPILWNAKRSNSLLDSSLCLACGLEPLELIGATAPRQSLHYQVHCHSALPRGKEPRSRNRRAAELPGCRISLRCSRNAADSSACGCQSRKPHLHGEQKDAGPFCFRLSRSPTKQGFDGFGACARPCPA